MVGSAGSTVALVSRDPQLVDDVRRLCALAAAPVQVCPDPAGLGVWWRTAVVVLVDAALADATVAAGLPRRPQVLVLAVRPDELAAWRAAVLIGAERVLTAGVDDQVLVDVVARAVEGEQACGQLLAVVPGCAGAGASTLAVALAVRAAAEHQATLVDLDAYGGGIDLPLGLEHAPGARWPELAATRGVVRRDAFEAAVLRQGALSVVSAGRGDVEPLPAPAVDAVLDAACRASPLVVADLPATPSEVSLFALARADVAIVVVTAQVRSVAAAAGIVHVVRRAGLQPALVLRTDRRDRLGARDVAAALGLEVTTVIATDHDVAAAADRGDLGPAAGAGRLRDVAAGLLERDGVRRAG
jgi:secretion/DNA translocation related CpaE-like protein